VAQRQVATVDEQYGQARVPTLIEPPQLGQRTDFASLKAG
jgi:hypothetical protein